MKKFKLILLLFFLSIFVNAQSIYTNEDVEICNSKFELAISKNLIEKPIGDILVEIGKTFLGLDYEAFTLEKGETEQLVINLTGLDCYTFFESSLVFARCIKKGKTTFEDYQKELANIRYRDGKINGYPSRLHYASDWLYDNNKRSNLQDITKNIGGIEFIKNINFMSSHSELYNQLKNNPKYVKDINAIEDSINSRNYYYIPQNFIGCIEDSINNGDIIFLTASASGLDISHTGMAVKMDDGRIHFMHAPLRGKKLQITEQTLSEYVKAVDSHTGIMVARVLEP